MAINGKGIVASLSEGDDFGKLSLVNNTPRQVSGWWKYSKDF